MGVGLEPTRLLHPNSLANCPLHQLGYPSIVVSDGFEPPHAESKSAVLPLDEETIKSGKQDSNLRPRTWKERALPTELLPLKK